MFDFLHQHGPAAIELRRKLDAHPPHFDTHLVTDALGDDVGATDQRRHQGLRRGDPKIRAGTLNRLVNDRHGVAHRYACAGMCLAVCRQAHLDDILGYDFCHSGDLWKSCFDS